MTFSKVLIANRGEIAARVIRTAHDLGYRTVAIASDDDTGAPHVRMADEAVVVGPAEAAKSYHDIDAILDAAARTGSDALHPGYGFLAENAEFADACDNAGITFIGPPSEAIRLMGNKRLAKLTMAAAGVPCIPGYEGEAQDDDALISAAADIGFPLMVKAAAGGGGRGMRLVTEARQLPDALTSARSESENAFGSGELILERAMSAARHIEIQVFADGHGNVVHLGERDCSLQRRHQKVIEEAPSPAVDEKLRAKMGKTAVRATQAIAYQGAGTVEFLLASDGRYFFLEMNTRLQVEHPVTEMTTGQDLVAWQLNVAAGLPLPLAQDGIQFTGHAVEARLYAEDPANEFLPDTGRLLRWRPATGRGVRVDAGIEEGFEISSHYDPLLAKVIAHGATRDEARRRLIRALEDTVVLGVKNNKQFLSAVLEHKAFRDGRATTGFIETYISSEQLAEHLADNAAATLGAALLYEHSAIGEDWRSATPAETTLRISDHNGETSNARIVPQSGRHYVVSWSDKGEPDDVYILDTADGRARYRRDGAIAQAEFAFDDGKLHLSAGGRQLSFTEAPAFKANKDRALGDGKVLAPMAGRIVAVRRNAGDQVGRSDVLVVLEAMKMEHEIRAGVDGTVAEVAVSEGDQVMPRQLLVAVEPVGPATETT